MRCKLLIWLFFCSVFFAAAQKKEQPTYFFTQASEKYFTDAEIDSLMHSTSEMLFKENRVPAVLFDKHYTVVRSLLVGAVKNNIIVSFKTIENKLKKNIVVENNSQQFADNKKLYREEFVKQVRNIFYSNKYLLSYISFNTSDRITYFNSTIRIGKDGKLFVTENITINNGDGSPSYIYRNDASLMDEGSINNEIKRGIFRTFPLYYVNKYKLFQNKTFKLKELLRDGKPEKSRIEKKNNGLLVYAGSSDYYLPNGKYTYTITYETEKQLKFFKNYDELYWNVTGNSWSFKIDSVQCTFILPKGAELLASKCYTGLQGAKNEDCNFTTTTVGDSTVVVYKTTQSLLPYEGLTIAASWPKGFVKAPGWWKQLKYYFWNNKAVFLLPLAALLSAIYCFIFWWRYGRDPEKGVIYPHFTPPAGYSPAALGYIHFQKFSRQLTAAMIVDAAVRNKISIDVERDGFLFKHNEYHIRKSSKTEMPPVSQYEDFESRIENLNGTIIEKGKYNSGLGSLNTEVEEYCRKNYKNKDGAIRKGSKGFFSLNYTYLTIPVLVCIGAGVWAFFDGFIKAAELKNFWQFGYFVAGIILCTQILRLFAILLKAYNPEGRKLEDQIEGFRLFLSTAEEKKFDLMNPPEKSLELYEKYLPFAIALGCEIEWGKKFEAIINTAYLDGTVTSSFSQNFTRDNNSFSSSFASAFSGAISSASTPPSSSSGGGSSGGGSSGGGGGGGGGGGW